jgi:polyphenol oxidase
VTPGSGAHDGRPIGAGATAGAPYAVVDDFADFGVRAVITTRAAGSFSLTADDPIGAVLGRWQALRESLGVAGEGSRFATAIQVHGARVIWHQPGWEGWLRVDAADGHCAPQRGTGLGVSVADCVPVFLAHPAGVIGLLHAGWRGTALRILPTALASFAERGLAVSDARVHIGPAICGACYEVGPAVYQQLTHRAVAEPTHVDLRELLVEQAYASGVQALTVSPWCTRCDNSMFFSHRAGDAGRQVAALMAINR